MATAVLGYQAVTCRHSRTFISDVATRPAKNWSRSSIHSAGLGFVQRDLGCVGLGPPPALFWAAERV